MGMLNKSFEDHIKTLGEVKHSLEWDDPEIYDALESMAAIEVIQAVQFVNLAICAMQKAHMHHARALATSPYRY